MDFKYIFLIIVLSIGLAWPEYSIAQQYIDIDLSAPPPPKKQQEPAKKPAPKPPQKVAPKPAPRPAAHPVARPQPAPRPAPKAVPAVKPAARPPTVPAKQQARPTPKPTPKPAPVVQKPRPAPAPPTPVPAPAPTQRPIAVPTPTPAPIPAPAPKAESTAAANTSSTDLSGEKPVRFKNRHGLSVDYTTWYETLKFTNVATKGLVEGNSHYFGISFNYDFTVYRENWGYAFNVGAITGNAQAGTKDSGDYYERRIVWTGFRAGGRMFWRANNRIDLGLGFLAQSKSTKWPVEDNYIVMSQANPHYFYYLDTRWRLNYRYELVQSFGTHLRSYALAWMLGLTYTLN